MTDKEKYQAIIDYVKEHGTTDEHLYNYLYNEEEFGYSLKVNERMTINHFPDDPQIDIVRRRYDGIIVYDTFEPEEVDELIKLCTK